MLKMKNERTKNRIIKLVKENNETSGITLVALVVTIVVLLILAGVTINLVFSDNGIIKIAQEAANKMNQAQEDTLQGLKNLANQLANITEGENPPKPPEENLPSDGSYSEEKGVNTPKLGSGMIPIKWNGSTWIETTGDDKDWYDYTTSAKKWANAKTSDGSMFVWIPRYSYQIASNYHNGGEGISGTINIKFLKDNTNTASDGTTSWNNGSGSGNWNIHPAFNYGQEIAGIWVAKFEASNSGGLKVIPGVVSWRDISVNDMYNTCINYNATLNSHMMKNSEWGASAYLAQSNYGKNVEVWINNSSSYITGSAGNSVSAGSNIGTTNDYTSSQGVQASTTGNVTGIYDMSGGAHEYTAGYVNNGNSNLTSNGASLVNGVAKTKEVYSYNTSQGDDWKYNLTANSSKYGDAIYETSIGEKGKGSDSWYYGYSYFSYSSWPFFLRGGNYDNTTSAGLFSFNQYTGAAHVSYGFRPVIVIL